MGLERHGSGTGPARAAWRLLLLAGAVSVAVVLPAASAAQRPGDFQTVMELNGGALAVPRREIGPLTDLGNSVRRARPIQDAALAAARRTVRSRDGLYVIALYELEIGRRRNDDSMRGRALDHLIASGFAPPDRLPGYLAERGTIAFQSRDYSSARLHWMRLLEIEPNRPDILSNLAQVHQAENDPAGAFALLERTIAMTEAAGRPASESLYRQRMTAANQARLVRPALRSAHALVERHPTPRNWRDALVVFRQLAAPTDGLEIDLLRTMRLIGVFSTASEYLRLAQLLRHSGAPDEARVVLDEGLSRGLLDAAGSPTREIVAEVDRARLRREASPRAVRGPAPGADNLFGRGRYAEAADGYRRALAAAADAGSLQTRLGMARFLAGERAQAEAAFRAAAAGEGGYADLARFWLVWLAQPNAPGAQPEPPIRQRR